MPISHHPMQRLSPHPEFSDLLASSERRSLVADAGGCPLYKGAVVRNPDAAPKGERLEIQTRRYRGEYYFVVYEPSGWCISSTLERYSDGLPQDPSRRSEVMRLTYFDSIKAALEVADRYRDKHRRALMSGGWLRTHAW